MHIAMGVVVFTNWAITFQHLTPPLAPPASTRHAMVFCRRHRRHRRGVIRPRAPQAATNRAHRCLSAAASHCRAFQPFHTRGGFRAPESLKGDGQEERGFWGRCWRGPGGGSERQHGRRESNQYTSSGVWACLCPMTCGMVVMCSTRLWCG